MVEIVKIGRAKPDQHIVDALEHLLVTAEAGDIRSLVFIGKHIDGSYQHYVSNEDKMDVLAQLARLQHRINAMLDEVLESVEYDEGETDDRD
jgi:hypothetical protein